VQQRWQQVHVAVDYECFLDEKKNQNLNSTFSGTNACCLECKATKRIENFENILF